MNKYNPLSLQPQRFLNKTAPNPIVELIEQAKNSQSTDPKKIIICGHCSNAITHAEEKTPIEGSIYHTFTNPFGHTFNIICFNDALGCIFEGTPIAADSWFPGCFWQYALCGNCHSHLGWYYTSGNINYFYGLIANRIIDQSNDL